MQFIPYMGSGIGGKILGPGQAQVIQALDMNLSVIVLKVLHLEHDPYFSWFINKSSL